MTSGLRFQVRAYSHTWESLASVQVVLFVFMTSRCENTRTPKTSSTWWQASCASRCEHIRTPESRWLLCRSFYSCLWLPGVKIRSHQKHHPLDDRRVALPGASIFAHLRVVGFCAGRSIRVYDFQVWKYAHTKNIIHLMTSELRFQVRAYSHTLALLA